MNKLIKHNGQTYEYLDAGVLHGFVKRKDDPIPDGEPWLQWKGEKMPHDMWLTILAFFSWTYNETKPSADEALVHLFYNEQEHKWIVWAPPQRGRGMTVKTADDHPNWKQAEDFVGYVKVGTGHHHCSSAAFQSGVDSNDECNCNGLHFTVGNLDKPFVTLHARMVFNGNMQQVELDDWIDMDPKYEPIADVYPELVNTMYDYSLQTNPGHAAPFPQHWKENFIKWTSSVIVGSTGHCSPGFVTGTSQSNHQAGNGHHSGYIDGRDGYWVTENGVRVFKKFPSRTPVELGEEALETMLNTGTPLIEMIAISEDMNKIHPKHWDRNNKLVRDVEEIIKKFGLNARWFEKWVEQEVEVRANGYMGVS